MAEITISSDSGAQENKLFLEHILCNSNNDCLFFWATKSLQIMIAAMKLKDAYFLEGKL